MKSSGCFETRTDNVQTANTKQMFYVARIIFCYILFHHNILYIHAENI